MALTAGEWTDVIFYFEFMAPKRDFGLDALKEPDRVPLLQKKELITKFCIERMYIDEEDVEPTLREKYAVEGKSIRAALNIVRNWKQFLLSRLTRQNLQRGSAFRNCAVDELDASLVLWREKAANLKLNVVPNFIDNTQAGGVEMWISYKDIQHGAIPTLFALGHEFGHQTDFAIREIYPNVLKSLYAGWSKDDHASWEYYADSLAIIFLTINSGDPERLFTAIEGYMGDTPDDGTHPAGFLRVNQMRDAQKLAI
jgi:hypothetical protein